MQIELNESTQRVLAQQAAAQGRPVQEYAADLLCRYAAASSHSMSGHFKIDTFEDALAWILSRNPNPLSDPPEDIDWQQLKSQGRRL